MQLTTRFDMNLSSPDVGVEVASCCHEMQSERPPMEPTIPYFLKRAPIPKSATRIFFVFVPVFDGFGLIVIFLYLLVYFYFFACVLDSPEPFPSW